MHRRLSVELRRATRYRPIRLALSYPNRNDRSDLADDSLIETSDCDGSVYSGDKTVLHPNFPIGPVQHHRGLQNITSDILEVTD